MADNTNTPTPTGTPTPTVKPVIVQSTIKKGRKLSPKAVVFGCLGFIAVFIIGLFGALYVGLQNPSKLANIGILPSNAKSLLMIIAGVFFGVIFLFGFGFFTINTYRLIKNRTTNKTKHFAGMFIGFILLAFAVGLGATAITKVQSIKVENFANTDELVIPYILTSNNNSSTINYIYAKTAGINIIAPLDIAYQVNADIVNLKYKNVAGSNQPLSMVLDCGNGTKQVQSQKVNGAGYIGGKNTFFDSTCLYVRKGTYSPTITFTYRDPLKQQNQSFTLNAGTITITAQLNVLVDGKPTFTNSGNTELIGGDAPVRVDIDAKNIFSELGLSDNNIVWDMDSDGTPDKENKVNFGFNYVDPKLYMVSYRFPNSANNLGNLRYHFYLRINQSDVPRCNVAGTSDGNTYRFTTTWPGGDASSQEVNSYRWEIYDEDREKTVDSIPSRTDSLEYTFAREGNYTARLTFATVNNLKGFCQSDLVHAGAPAYNVKYAILYKKPGQSVFSEFPSTGTLSQNGDNVMIDSLPIDIQVRVTDISPKPVSSTITMRIGDTYMIKRSPTVFETTIREKQDHDVTITVEDEQGTKSEKIIPIKLNQSVIQGVLQADTYNGPEPLTVNLDASTTKLNDDSDEIIYFTWDFGDGEIAKNVSQGKLSHIYIFNQKTQSGQYIPQVTVVTKKGFTSTFRIDIPITVTRKASTVDIRLPSNPTQVALINTPVDMEMSSDGPVSKITWDFGDGKSFYCLDRSCSSIKHAYSSAGDYSINVRVEYQDRPFAVDTIKIKVQ